MPLKCVYIYVRVLTSTRIPTVTCDTQGGIRVTSLASVLSDLRQ